jgi:hypothetical protein
MTKSVKDVGSEDILSSVRRLISEDRVPPVDAAHEPLVLNSSARVDEPVADVQKGRATEKAPVTEGPVDDETLFSDLEAFLNDEPDPVATLRTQSEVARPEAAQKGNDVTARIEAFESALDSIEAREKAAPVPEQQDNIVDDNAEILDEETLRKIIAEVVREELRGKVGEQITRNLRELVRREIIHVLQNNGKG